MRVRSTGVVLKVVCYAIYKTRRWQAWMSVSLHGQEFVDENRKRNVFMTGRSGLAKDCARNEGGTMIESKRGRVVCFDPVTAPPRTSVSIFSMCRSRLQYLDN